MSNDTRDVVKVEIAIDLIELKEKMAEYAVQRTYNRYFNAEDITDYYEREKTMKKNLRV